MSESGNRSEVEKILDTELPSTVEDIQFARYQPNLNLSAYYAYIKLNSSEEEYLNLMSSIGATIYDGSNPKVRGFFPGQWKVVPALNIEWWDAEVNVPDQTAFLYDSTEGSAKGFLRNMKTTTHTLLWKLGMIRTEFVKTF